MREKIRVVVKSVHQSTLNVVGVPVGFFSSTGLPLPQSFGDTVPTGDLIIELVNPAHPNTAVSSYEPECIKLLYEDPKSGPNVIQFPKEVAFFSVSRHLDLFCDWRCR